MKFKVREYFPIGQARRPPLEEQSSEVKNSFRTKVFEGRSVAPRKLTCGLADPHLGLNMPFKVSKGAHLQSLEA